MTPLSLLSLLLLLCANSVHRASAHQHCGFTPIKPHLVPVVGRIDDARPYSFPWAVLICQRDSSEPEGLYCPHIGSIVGEKWILAANRLSNDSAEEYMVVTGVYDLNNKTGPGTKQYPIYRIHSMPGRPDNIALVELAEPIEFNDSVQPICLAASDNNLTSNGTAWAVGWTSVNMMDTYDKIQQMYCDVIFLPEEPGFFTSLTPHNHLVGPFSCRYTHC